MVQFDSKLQYEEESIRREEKKRQIGKTFGKLMGGTDPSQ